MNAERLKQIEEIYHAALEIPADKRQLFVEDRCGADDELIAAPIVGYYDWVAGNPSPSETGDHFDCEFTRSKRAEFALLPDKNQHL